MSLNGATSSLICTLGVLLSEESREGILLSKVANMSCRVLEEELKLPTSYFSHAINLLNKLLKDRPHISLPESRLVSTNRLE